jgi:hypothetical protein
MHMTESAHTLLTTYRVSVETAETVTLINQCPLSEAMRAILEYEPLLFVLWAVLKSLQN